MNQDRPTSHKYSPSGVGESTHVTVNHWITRLDISKEAKKLSLLTGNEFKRAVDNCIAGKPSICTGNN